MQVPIFYINLASRPDRREFMERQFAELGLAAERVEAITVDQVPQPLIDYHLQPHPGRRCSPGELACGLSHAAVWQLILDRGHNAAIVLEDDALLSPAIVPFANDPDLLRATRADLIRLETWRSEVRLGSPVKRLGQIALQELAAQHLGSSAYLISAKAAAHTLLSPRLHQMQVDLLLFSHLGIHLFRSRVLQANPSPAIQLHRHGKAPEIGLSDISPYRTSKRIMFSNGNGGRWRRLLASKIAIWAGLARLWLRDPMALLRRKQVVAYAGEPPLRKLKPAGKKKSVTGKSRRPARR
jgi:glycosyl transferase family 25